MHARVKARRRRCQQHGVPLGQISLAMAAYMLSEPMLRLTPAAERAWWSILHALKMCESKICTASLHERVQARPHGVDVILRADGDQ